MVRSVIRRLVRPNNTMMPSLAPETRAAFRRLRMVFPPAFPERTVGFFALIRYLVEEGVPGDVVECGVGRGVSFFLLADFMAKLGHPGRLYGFDSFAGFPVPSAEDKSARNSRAGQWSDTSPAHVEAHFRDAGLGSFFSERCQLVPGFFDTTLKGTLPFTRISLLHLDVDLYESYKVSGSILEPLVDAKGIVVFDEYNEPAWPGATKAVNEIVAASRRGLFRSRLMNKYLAIDRAHWGQPSPALAKLRDDLQVQPA